MTKQDIPKFTMKFKDIMSFDFEQALQKIQHTPTTNKNACAIHKVVQAMKKQREVIVNRYKAEFTDVYAQKDDKGEIIFQPNGAWLPADDKAEEFKAKHDAFEAEEFTVQVRPLTPSVLVDVKLSARDIEVLGALFSEEDAKPQLPPGAIGHLQSV